MYKKQLGRLKIIGYKEPLSHGRILLDQTMFRILHLEMESIPLPYITLHWSKRRRYKLIADAMTLNRFSMLRNNFHYAGIIHENEKSENKFWKVRPIMIQFLKVLREELPDPEKGYA